MITISAQDFDGLKNNSLFKKIIEEKNKNNLNNRQEALDFVDKNMSAEQAQKFRNVIKDKEKINALLSSDEAKKLLKYLMEGDKNG